MKYIADKLLESLNIIRKQRWQEAVENVDFTCSNHKAWGFIKRLGGDNHKTTQSNKFKSNDIASQRQN